MSVVRQILILIVLLAAGVFVWLRLDDSAAGRLVAIGVPESMVSMVAAVPADVGKGSGRNGAPRRNVRPSPVITSTVGSASINDRVTAIGDGEAVRSVIVVPQAPGILGVVLVKPGDNVEAGDLLAELDSETQKIARDRAELAFDVAEKKVARFEKLWEARASSEVELINAKIERDNAELALRDAELELRKRSITAPIGGIVGFVQEETGDYVTQQTEIVTIDDRSSILVDFWIPERFSLEVRQGQRIEVAAIAIPGRHIEGQISAIGSRVDKASRTIRVRALLDNSEDLMRPGMSFRVVLRFPGDDYPAVDPLAVQWSSTGPYVWKVADGKSERIAVRILQRNSDYVLVSGDLATGDEVVTEGLQSLRPGSDLEITRNTGSPVVRGS
jgi:RND family efflux transporter MFP subunit